MPIESSPPAADTVAARVGPRESQVRLRLRIRGAVQGVGFRPFVYRLARELELAGWVRNDSHGVEVEIEGPRARLELFLARLTTEKPAPAILQSVAAEWLAAAAPAASAAPGDCSGFAILPSATRAGKSAVVLPDLATCAECRSELFAPGDRRFHYPFTNCTHCGPRFSIVLGLPYDRPSTTMRGFALCPACRGEYEEPASRRFHAQPNACPECGPQLRSTTPAGEPRAERAAALADVAAALARGEIAAIKGIGGFQLLCDARSPAAVAALRARKQRPAKPLALMVRDVGTARGFCRITAEEAALLESPQAPIVLLQRRTDPTLPALALAPELAPGNPRLGVMLPTSPLHHLLLAEADFPLVATSGNLADEPIAIDDREALVRLGAIADLFLLHDRPIARHVDDSVAWLADGAPQLLRRARGYAPLPLLAGCELPCLVATGAHQKVTAALSVGDQIFLSQHLGDMETPEAHAAFERVILDFLDLYGASPVAIVHDLHPDYPTTHWAARAARATGGLLERAGRPARALPLVAVQHHHAHLASCLAEHGAGDRMPGPALGLCFDGTGYGPDGTVWGGEALVAEAVSAVSAVSNATTAGSFFRLARLRPFRLPGGEAAVREPRRIALALLHQLEGVGALARRDIPAIATFQPAESAAMGRMLEAGWNAPWTSSMGRLFDGVAALVGVGGSDGLGARVSFEAEAAMALEFAATLEGCGSYPLPLVESLAPAGLAPGQIAHDPLYELDWRPMIAALLCDRARGESVPRIVARFHQALVDGALAIAQLAAGASAGRGARVERVALSGGCFQNRLLSERLAGSLRAAGFTVLLQRAVPPNDGGIALGQIAVAAARLAAN